MASYPRPYEHAKWIWEVQDAFTGALLPDFAGRLHLIDEVGRVEHLFRPRIDPTHRPGPWLGFYGALQLQGDMQDFYDGVDPLAPLVDAVDHIWPGDPGYDDSESEEDDEDGTEENAKKDAEEEDAEEDGEAGDEDPFASSPAETPSKGMGSMSLASAKPKAKVKGRKGCKDNKPNNRMDSEDSDDEAPNTPTKRNRVGRLIPAPHRSGRTQRKSTPRANSNQPSTNKAVGSKLVSILTPTKRKVSGSLNEPISQKTVRFASPLDDSAAGTQVAIGSSKAAIETPSKRTRKKPEFDVKRGSRTGLDAPAYNIKLPNITITTLEILTFLPELTRDAGAMHRFASNNWAVHILTTVLNEVRDWPETHKHMFTRSTVLGRMKKAFKTIEPNSSTWKESEYQSRMPRDARVIDYTTAQFRISREDTITDDVWLSSLALNVKAFPTGDEAGVLTLAVELVRARPELDCLLSKLVDFARTHNLTAPSYTVRKDKASLVGWMKVAATKPSKSFGDLPEKKADSGQEDGDAEADAVADADADEEVVVDDQDGESVEHDTATADFGGMSVVDDNSAVEDGELDLFAQYETFGMFPPSMFEGAGFN